MLKPSGSTPIGNDVGAQLPQRFRHHLVGGAIGAIDHDAQAVEREIARQRALGEFDVAVMHAVDAAGAAEARRSARAACRVGSSSSCSICFSTSSESLKPSGPNSLMPLSSNGLCEAEIITPRSARIELGQHRDRRRRHRAEQQHVHADRGEARDHRVFDHVAGQAGVLADHDAVAMLAALEHKARGLADLERELRRDQAVGAAPNPVRPEIFAAHIVPHATTRDPHVQPAGALHGSASLIMLRSYKAFAANLASKNMINHYGTGAGVALVTYC